MSRTRDFISTKNLLTPKGVTGTYSTAWDEVETQVMVRQVPDEAVDHMANDTTDHLLPVTPLTPIASLPDTDSATTMPASAPRHIGRYALKYRIGEGGLGTVYAAKDPLLSRLIAVKILNVDVADQASDTFISVFLNEAKAAGRLSHPNIVTVFDAGSTPQGAYIAMELLKGKDLRHLLKEGWRPTPQQAALIVRRVADALSYAHSKGVIHRDIKPANIFMVGRTQPRVLDFGIAQIVQKRGRTPNKEIDNKDSRTPVGGSPYYMAPEQIRQESIDRRTDVYSLGVVLYELLTGKRLFEGSSLGAITEAVLTQAIAPPHTLNPLVPKALSDITIQAIQKNREHRTRSARQLSYELRHWLNEEASPTLQPEPAVSSLTGPTRRPFVWLGLATLALLIAGLAWYLYSRSPRYTQQAESLATYTKTTAALATQAQTAAPASAVIKLSNEPVNVTTSAPTVPPAQAASTPLALLVEEQATTPTPAETKINDTRSASVEQSKPASTESPLANAKNQPDKTTLRRTRKEPVARRNTTTQAIKATAATPGKVHLAISPWGNIEVDGQAAGTTPPLTQLSLAPGRHTITVRNDAYPPYTQTIQLEAEQTVYIKHRFTP